MQVWEYPSEKRAVTYEDVNDVYKIQRSHKDNGSESRQRVNREMCGSGNIDKKYEQAY